MPGVDSQLFSSALSVFLFFGAANLTIELMISFVLICKRLKATIQGHYDLELGKLKPAGSLCRDEFSRIDADLLGQVMALSPADRQIVSSFLDALSRKDPQESGPGDKITTQSSLSEEDEDLGWLRFSGGKSNSSLTH